MRSLLLVASLLAATLITTLVVVSPSPVAQAEETALTSGESTRQMHGLKVTLEVPEDFDAAKETSLVVILHGNGGSGAGMAHSLKFLNEKGYVVVAPKSTDIGWSTADIEAVRAITKDALTLMNAPPHRRHAIGYSNGGWNLEGLAFDEELEFASACWVAAGYRGGKVPKSLKKRMGALALAGADDPNASSAHETVKLLDGKVRSASVRIQPDLGHNWPTKLMPFYGWWLGVQEGRYTPGDTMAFDWVESPRFGIASLGEGKRGGFGYWFSADDSEDERAKLLQNELMLDPAVQFYGQQLVAWKADRNVEKDEWRLLNTKTTPAIAIYGSDGGLRKVLTGKIKAKSLASALKAVSPVKKLPK